MHTNNNIYTPAKKTKNLEVNVRQEGEVGAYFLDENRL